MKVICTITIQMLLFQGSVKIRMNQQTVVPRLPYNAILSAYVISISSSLVRLFQSKFLAVSEFNIRTTWWIPNKFNFFFLFFFLLFFQTILASAFVKKDYDKATTIASRVLQVCKYFDTSLPFFGSSTFSLFSSFLNCLWFYTQLSVVLGLVLTVNLLVGLPFSSRLFTKDLKVLQLIGVGIPVLFSNFPQTTHTMFYHKCRVYIISELNCPFCWLVYCSNSTY